MAQLLPLKSRILFYFSKTQGEICADDILRDLKNEYGTDGQFTKAGINNHLDSLRTVGMITNTSVEFDSSNELVIKYKITEDGIDKLKYLPPEWRNLG